MKLIEIKENEEDFEYYANLIKKDCKPFLEKVDPINLDKLIYRGMDENKFFIHKDVRKNRKPFTTPSVIQEFVDNYLKEKYGKQFRSNSIFVSGSPYVATTYGTSYIIFPIGNFEFLWSPHVSDLTPNLALAIRKGYDKAEQQYDVFQEISKFKSPEQLPDNVKEQLTKTLQKVDYKLNDNLEKAIESDKEIMIKCDSYYAIKKDTQGKAHAVLKNLMGIK